VNAVSRGISALHPSVCTGFGFSVLHTTHPPFMNAALAVLSSTELAWATNQPFPEFGATNVLASTRFVSVSAAASYAAAACCVVNWARTLSNRRTE